MIVGAHLRNEARLLDSDVERFKIGNFTGALVMSYHGPEAAARMGTDPANCIVRLPDSVYKKWPSGEAYIPSYQDYADDCVTCIANFYADGYRLFQLSCEDDLLWHTMTINGKAANAYDWAWFMEHAVEAIRKALRAEGITQAKLGYTPLSVGAPLIWWNASAAYRAECDFLTAHAYWQVSRDMSNPDFGANYQRALREAGTRPVYVTECANSICQEQPSPPPPVIEASMALQYPQYIKQCVTDGVSGVFFYILGSSPEWAGFNLTSMVCRAIAVRGGSSGSSKSAGAISE